MKYTLNVKAVCDENGCFLDVDYSWPGSVHDTKKFASSYIIHSFKKTSFQILKDNYLKMIHAQMDQCL